MFRFLLLVTLATYTQGKSVVSNAVDDGLKLNFKSALSSNLNGCPTLSSQCPSACLDVDVQGCLICSCPDQTGSSATLSSGGNATSTASHSGAGSGVSGNNNGCPPFPKSCASDCTDIDQMGCIVCRCTASASQTGSGTQTAGTGSSSSGNINGCQPFPKSCQTECTKINDMGCIVCDCSEAQTNTLSSGTGTGSGINNSSSGNNNGCPAFPKSCKSECMQIDDYGCIVCVCPANVASNSMSSGQTGSSPGGSFALGVACPPFDKNCDTACVEVDSVGCIVCSCSDSSTNVTSGHAQTAGGGSGCPALDTGCDPDCVTVDSVGCIRCSCQTSGPSSGNGCPTISKDCPMSCLTIDAGTGCVLCSCSAASKASTTETPVICKEIYIDSCDKECLGLDSNGCVTCSCSGSTSAPISSSPATTATPISTSGSTFAHVTTAVPTETTITMVTELSTQRATSQPTVTSTADPNPAVTATPYISGHGNSGGCPAFSLDNCDAACVEIDRLGCLSCKCTTASPGQTTQSPSGGGQTIPGICAPFDADTCDPACVTVHDTGCFSCECTSGNGTVHVSTTPSSGGGNVHPGGCSSFDPMTCPTDCVQMDDRGCISCSCTSDIPIGSTTPATSVTPSSGENVHPGGCPSFDPMACRTDCVQMDDRGCISCSCTSDIPIGSTTPATSVTPSSGGNVHPGGCPSFDPMTCPTDCVQMDDRGCISCSCTSDVPSGSTTVSPGSGNVHPGGCPSFDPMTCRADCVHMDDRGCLSCTCPSGTPTAKPTIQTSTQIPTVLTNKPSTSTNAPGTTKSSTQPHTETTVVTQAPVGTQAPGVTQAPVVTQVPVITQAPILTPSSTDSTVLCPPVRCSAPCNLGILMDTNGCPKCRCRA